MDNLKNKSMEYIFLISAIFSIIAVLLICVFLFSNAIPAIKEIGFYNFIFGISWQPSDSVAKFGILPMILGSLYVTIGAILIGVPIGVFTAVYLSFYSENTLDKILNQGVRLMAGIPSVVYGFFGMTVIVPIIRKIFGGTGSSILAASILLGVMILPTIISISKDALSSVDREYYEGSLALGASKTRTIFYIVLPAAKSGIITSIVLGIGRAIGETMAVVMIAGNQARIPTSILQGVRTMTANIVLEMGYAAEIHRQALIATGAVLFIFILLINISFSLIEGGNKIGNK